MVQLGYEARNGKPHDPEGNAGGNVFEEKHLEEILAFEEKVIKLEGYEDFCAKKDNMFDGPCENFFFTPRLLTHAEELNMPDYIYGCCDCNGNTTMADAPENKVCATKSSVPVCINPRSGGNVTKAVIPNGKATSMLMTLNTKDTGILPKLADTLACGIETKKHSMIGVIKGLFDRKFSPEPNFKFD